MRREEFIQELARGAGEIVLKGFKQSEVEYTKHDRLDLVTDMDLASNEFITNKIKDNFPDDGIISEEANKDFSKEDYTWVIDPLDGTVNFATGIPIFVVMLALVRDGDVILSAIFDPVHDTLAFAKKGGGAFVNGKMIHCSDRTRMIDSRGLMSFIVKEQEIYLRGRIVEKGNDSGVRMGVNAFGCAGFNAICVAEGKREWTVGFNRKVWDVAPSALLLMEAGCKVTNHKGEQWKLGMPMVAANEQLHQELIKALEGMEPC